MDYTIVSVKVLASVQGDTEIEGMLGMKVRKDDPTDTYLGFMPSLQLYAQGRTMQETERMMERVAALFLKIAIQEDEWEKILLHRGFHRRLGPAPQPGPGQTLDTLTVTSLATSSERSAEESGMELDFAGR